MPSDYERVWWIAEGKSTGAFTTSEATVEGARKAGWQVVEYVRADLHAGAVERAEQAERFASIIALWVLYRMEVG